jgi:L,D-transpeptidase catalytic domain
MKVFTNLLFKVTLSSMVLTAPAMISGNAGGSLLDKEAALPFYSSAVIKNFIDHLTVGPLRAYAAFRAGNNRTAAATVERSSALSNAALSKAAVSNAVVKLKSTAVVRTYIVRKTAEASVRAAEVSARAAEAPIAREENSSRLLAAAAFKAAELRRVIDQSAVIYGHMDLEKEGLSEKAFEYAWRGYHNLLKKGSIRKTSVLSICDFSQSSNSRRMYVIDVRHKRLLYRTYVAHGQNSGEEFAASFSNEQDSYKSSLGFYVTQTTYYGRNGLSLRLNGVDSGYNDQALKRKIVLHGSSYVGDQYMQNFGTIGTSLGCPALPAAISSRIIRTVRGGSCFFIYHPTQQYLDNSTIIND